MEGGEGEREGQGEICDLIAKVFALWVCMEKCLESCIPRLHGEKLSGK